MKSINGYIFPYIDDIIERLCKASEYKYSNSYIQLMLQNNQFFEISKNYSNGMNLYDISINRVQLYKHYGEYLAFINCRDNWLYLLENHLIEVLNNDPSYC